MRYVAILLALFFACLLAACATEPPTPSADMVMTAIAGTQVAHMNNTPVLIAPEDGAEFEHPGGVALEWEWMRPLVGDEAYDVRIWRAGEPEQGITWAYQSDFDLELWLSQQEPGEFFWTIAVLGGQAGEVNRMVTNPAAPFSFSVADNRIPPPDEPTDNIPAHTIRLPAGFVAEQYLDVPEAAGGAAIAFGPDGLLYMLMLDGAIWKFDDEDGDGAVDARLGVFLDLDEQLSHAVGMTWRDDVMYLSDSGKISTLTDEDGDGALETLTPIVEGLISLQYWGHSNNGIAFNPVDGRLYVGIGASTDHGPLQYPDEEGLFLSMNPDGSDQRVFATGFRNPYDLAFSPDGDLFTTDNNPDRMGKDLRFLPSEEVNHVVEGGFYGFPRVFGPPVTEEDGIAPVSLLLPSVGSAGMTWYADDHFPPEYRDGVYIALSGTLSSNIRIARSITNGFAVVFVPLTKNADGEFEGDWEVFAQFNQDIDNAESSEFDYLRPVDVTVGPDGALYILEHTRSIVYRVTYTGQGVADASTADTSAGSAVDDLGATLFDQGANQAQACSVCHRLDDPDTGLGPPLAGKRAEFAERIEGLSAAAYVRQSILNPGVYVVDGYDNIMYPLYEDQLTPEQIDALVEYVLALAD